MEKTTSFYCFICDKVVTCKGSEFLHFEEHLDIKSFKCLECEYRCSNELELDEHLSSAGHFDFEKNTNLTIQKFVTFLSVLSPQIENVSEEEISNYTVLLLKEEEKTQLADDKSNNKPKETFEKELFNPKNK